MTLDGTLERANLRVAELALAAASRFVIYFCL